jgi:hypothetical protein
LLLFGSFDEIEQVEMKHPNLARLHEVIPTLSYPGWEMDVELEEKMHRILPRATFEKCLFRLEEKQRMYKGDRSHKRLVKLDSQNWSFPGWKDDFDKAEEYHVWNRKGRSFERVYKEMVHKQRCFDALWSLHESAQTKHERAVQSPATRLDEAATCVICVSAPRSHIFIPCGHLCACMSCATQSFKSTRPFE